MEMDILIIEPKFEIIVKLLAIPMCLCNIQEMEKGRSEDRKT